MADINERFRYRYNRLARKPYWGTHLRAIQGDPSRHILMQALAAMLLSETRGTPLCVLEIGSWAGGSAVTWATVIRQRNESLGAVFCVDPWSDYFDLTKDTAPIARDMKRAFVDDEIFRLFLHNIRTSGYRDLIRVLRGTSDEILPILRPAAFDIIYIDGLHTYEQVYRDIKHSEGLVREGGILCGDDLELQAPEIDIVWATAHADIDYIQEPRTGRWFHPGVTLAVHHALGQVSVWNGLWGVRKCRTGWSPISLTTASDFGVPGHLQ